LRQQQRIDQLQRDGQIDHLRNQLRRNQVQQDLDRVRQQQLQR
jgi:hypothetical protein